MGTFPTINAFTFKLSLHLNKRKETELKTTPAKT